MAQPNTKAWSVEDYFLFEEQETTKYEYLDGLVYALHASDVEAMAGASEAHIIITGNIFAQLHSALDGQTCRAYQSDMRVQATDSTFFYPDVVAVCGERNFRDENRTTLTNPTVVFEVLSPSTENYDRGKKFIAYRQCSSLKTYILVSQDKQRIEHYERQADDSWVLREYSKASSQTEILIRSLGVTLTFSAIYANIE
ncbi:MAG: Uma2 family endonuclease [Chloroflexota bacterium]